jgi:phospholipase C
MFAKAYSQRQDMCKLAIWPYAPLFVLADHYWLSVEPQAEAQLAWFAGSQHLVCSAI